ncbi:hypothetical protein G7069_01245 [Lysobacter sp. HDW10]|uniref:hypothetical protein n=1 Tax=Lysobacter sp. HDW10 TaxID=2714936 RepID=UPI00140D1949|nr:hypothetical protein [Lysobacter sp. HDW10]QIK80345.1 hypothetical protein G7069_01245 [Lysobacter sp. HDW10]
MLVILPSTEYLNLFLLENRDQIQRLGCEIPLVRKELYLKLSEKRSATDLFEAEGFRVPKEIESTRLTPPIVAKPKSNRSTNGVSNYPHLLLNGQELEKFPLSNRANDYFFQEYVVGESHYLMFYICKNTNEVYKWSQRNLLQQQSGKSILFAEPSFFHESAGAAAFISALSRKGFHGIGMIEVIRRDGDDVFIEFNPRIWGPIQFCLDQRQEILQAFIGETLTGTPHAYLDCLPSSKKNYYLWLGGLLESLLSSGRLSWKQNRWKLLSKIVRNIGCDVYFRSDTIHCFRVEIMSNIKLRWWK